MVLPAALRHEQPGQLADEEGVATAPPPHLAAHSRGHGRPGNHGDHRLDIGRGERRERELLRAAGQLTELVRRFPVPVRTEQQHPARRQRPGQEPEQPQRRLVRPLQIVEDDQQRPRACEGPQRAGHRLEQPKLRIRGGDRARRGRACGGVEQPTRLAELGHRQSTRAEDLRPRPVRRRSVALPAGRLQDERLGSGLADQRPENRGLADPGIAADHQELTGTGQYVLDHGCGSRQHRCPPEEPFCWDHAAIIAGQGRSSKIRFIGASTLDLRTRVKPASPASARSRCSPAWAPSGSDEVLVRCETALGVHASVDTA